MALVAVGVTIGGIVGTRVTACYFGWKSFKRHRDQYKRKLEEHERRVNELKADGLDNKSKDIKDALEKCSIILKLGKDFLKKIKAPHKKLWQVLVPEHYEQELKDLEEQLWHAMHHLSEVQCHYHQNKQ